MKLRKLILSVLLLSQITSAPLWASTSSHPPSTPLEKCDLALEITTTEVDDLKKYAKQDMETIAHQEEAISSLQGKVASETSNRWVWVMVGAIAGATLTAVIK